MSSQGGPDTLYSTLNPLVQNGTLTPYQADQVYRAVGARGESRPATRTDAAAGWDRPRLLAAGCVLAAGLLVTAYALAAGVDEEKGLGWKSTVILGGTTLVLVAASAASALLLKDRPWGLWVSGVLGALALAGFAFGLVVLWDPDTLVYVAAVLMLLGGAAGFWFLQSQLFTVVAVFGGALLLGQIFSDTLSDSGDPGDTLTVGIGFLLFGLVVTAAGWRFACRHLLGALGLGIAIIAMLLVIYVNAAFSAIAVAYTDGGVPGSPASGDSDAASIRTDIRVAMFLGLIVVVLASLAHAYTSYVAFAVLAFAGAALLPVSAVFALQSEHPLRWALAFAAVGALAVAAAVGSQIDRRRPSRPTQPEPTR